MNHEFCNCNYGLAVSGHCGSCDGHFIKCVGCYLHCKGSTCFCEVKKRNINYYEEWS